jgi:hypothetical protein
MADEFFRPFFSQGLFAQGNLLRTLQYRWMIGNNNSNLDVPATKLDRDLSAGGAVTWLPTTGEFGPRGAFGDYESHEKLATRFNLAYTFSPEERQSPLGTPANNTTLRLADSLNVFDTGALANGVTVERTHYQLVSADPHEFIVVSNYYPWDTRNLRLNVQVINVAHSPVSSTFGFYTGQITGPVVSIGFTALY